MMLGGMPANGNHAMQNCRMHRHVEGYPEKLRLKMPVNAELIGGACGRKLRVPEKNAVASALCDLFHPRGEPQTFDGYVKELTLHEEKFNVPYIMATADKLGWKAVLLLRQGKIPKDSSEVADEEAWMRDDRTGKYFIFRKNIPDRVEN